MNITRIVIACAILVGVCLGLDFRYVSRGTLGIPGWPQTIGGLGALTAPELVSLGDMALRLKRCGEAPHGRACTGVVYTVSERMPLSELGIAEVRKAAKTLKVKLNVVRTSDLDVPLEPSRDSLRVLLIAAGAGLHAPAIVTYRDGVVSTEAILGYKSAHALVRWLQPRLFKGESKPRQSLAHAHPVESVETAWRDFALPSRPGAYVRWVPHHNLLSFSAGGTNRLLDLKTGNILNAPGFIDLIPAPDGTLFVTPSREGTGLKFYDARDVLRSNGETQALLPIFIDSTMTDQYPSVGILKTNQDTSSAVYRVLTSWSEGIVYRDYNVKRLPSARMRVEPVDTLHNLCPGVLLSIPILSPSGRQVAARDETTGATSIFWLNADGTCERRFDFGFQTGKVSWHPSEDAVAFAIPPTPQDQEERGDQATNGAFVLDLVDHSVRQVNGSHATRRLSFPEFVGPDSIAVQYEADGMFRFRMICCVGIHRQ
jgi:hypothetical protein